MSPFYANRLRRYYADITVIITQILRKQITQSLRILRIVTQINYADITQINYANHYADYAIITRIHYANMITQFPKISLRRLRKYHYHWAMGNFADA